MNKNVFCLGGLGFLFFLSLTFLCFGVSAQNQTFTFKGKTYVVPQNYLDPAFPAQEIANGDISSPSYLSYVDKHAFPVENKNFSENVKVWSANNAFFPQFLPTGSPAADSARYRAAVDKWIDDNPYAVSLVVGNVNNTELPDDVFNILFFSFPRVEDFMSSDDFMHQYNTAMNKWIKLYSYEKYLLIKPAVDNSTANNI